MVARKQHIRYALAVVILGPRVVRTIKQSGRERVLLGGLRVVQHAGQSAHDRIDQHHGGEFPAGQYVIADRDFLVDFALNQAFVHTFVATAQQHDTRRCRQFAHSGIRQRPALRGQVDDPGPLDPQCLLSPPRGINRLRQRVHQHDHAGTTAIRTVVDRLVIVGGVVARVPGLKAPDALLDCPSRHTVLRHRVEHRRKQRDDIDLHQ